MKLWKSLNDEDIVPDNVDPDQAHLYDGPGVSDLLPINPLIRIVNAWVNTRQKLARNKKTI